MGQDLRRSSSRRRAVLTARETMGWYPAVTVSTASAGWRQGQVSRLELQCVPRSPQPWQVRLRGATRHDDLRALGYPRDHHAQYVVAGRRLQLVKVVEHEHERNGAPPQYRGEARRGASQKGNTNPSHVGDHERIVRRNPSVCRRQHGQQDRRVVVEAIKRDPSDLAILDAGPLGQQRRLAVPRGRGDRDHTAVARTGPLYELVTAHQTRARARNRELGLKQQCIEFDSPRHRLARIPGHPSILGTAHGRPQPSNPR